MITHLSGWNEGPIGGIGIGFGFDLYFGSHGHNKFPSFFQKANPTYPPITINKTVAIDTPTIKPTFVTF